MRHNTTMATIRKDGKIEDIELSEMTDDLYKEVYGYLFCPNDKCSAKIIYASGKKRIYFKTWTPKHINGVVQDQHIQDCPYFVDREKDEKLIRGTDPNNIYAISDRHIQNALHYTYDRQYNPKKFEKKINSNAESKTGKSIKTKIDPALQKKGKPGLSSDGANEEAEREPNIYRRSVDEIVLMDYNSVQCVHGFVEDMVLNDKYPYIKLNTKDGRTARILFSEAFRVNNEVQYNNAGLYKWYIDTLKSEGKEVFCCCVGKITKDDFEISIVIDKYVALNINDIGYYGIFRLANKL